MTANVATPGEAEQHYALGRAHKARNDLIAAEQSYRQALRLRPGFLDAWMSLGIALRAAGRLDEAEACQREALKLDPGSALALLNLGSVLSSQSRSTEAADCFRRAIRIDPRSAKAHCNLGAALLQLGDPSAALSFLEAVRLNPRNFEAAEGLATSLADARAFELTAASIAQVQRARPDALGITLLLAEVCLVARKFDAARAEYEKLLHKQPGNFDALIGLSSVLTELGFAAESRTLLEKALARQPDNPRVRSAYAALLLRHGDFAKAWDYYESRSAGGISASPFDRGLTAPRWRGEPLAGQTLLIAREQGLGDELMFASVVPDMVSDAAHVIVECDRRLEPLFRRSFSGATVFGVDPGEVGSSRELERNLHALPAFDYWIPMGSLPYFRRRTPESFRQNSPYLMADRSRAAHWKSRLDALGAGSRVGLTWRGGTAVSRSTVRTLTLEQLTPVLATPNVHFVSLQHGKCREEIDSFSGATGVPIHHWPEAIENPDETAALLSSLDLLVSVCTAVVNLGGALNQPVWVMAPFVADARYGWQGPTSIWYPSLRVFRQPRLDAWQPLIAEVQQQLRGFAQASR